MNEASKFYKRLSKKWKNTLFPKGGRILDVGFGGTPIIPQAQGWDLEQGDATYLQGLEDCSFDTVFSSHCIEHLANPALGLQNWWRVVKPFGWLVVLGPDEDLYEQGVWPSVFNPDHKVSLTLSKSFSWNQQSVNLVQLVGGLIGHKLHLAKITDGGKLPRIKNNEIKISDITQGKGEAGVEVIVQKIPLGWLPWEAGV